MLPLFHVNDVTQVPVVAFHQRSVVRFWMPTCTSARPTLSVAVPPNVIGPNGSVWLFTRPDTSPLGATVSGPPMSIVMPADDTSLRFPIRSTDRARIVYPPAAGGLVHVQDHGVDVAPTDAGVTVNHVSVEDQALPVHQLPVAVCCTPVSMDATPESSAAVPLTATADSGTTEPSVGMSSVTVEYPASALRRRTKMSRTTFAAFVVLFASRSRISTW